MKITTREGDLCMTTIKDIHEIALRIKRDVIQLTAMNTGHPGGAIGVAEIIAELYFNRLKHNPQNPDWEERDYFILSNGHICAALYSAMARTGYFNIDELFTFRKINSRLQAHPSKIDLPGIETSSGPLGQGLSIANGIALANRMKGIDSKVYCLVGDGELQEGQIWEAAMTSSHYQLDQLALIISWNDIQIDGHVKDVMNIEPLADKFNSFGWNTVEIDGHDIQEVQSTFDEFENNTGAPTAIIAKTVLGNGISFMENKAKWHGTSPSPEEAKQALTEIGTSSFGTDLTSENKI